jgi:hypothetical protein
VPSGQRLLLECRPAAYDGVPGLLHEDVRLCIDEAETLGVPMLVGAAVRELLAVTNAKFGADSDFTSIARVVEDWAGVQSRG